MIRLRFALMGSLVALGACHGSDEANNSLAALDNQLTRNAADPALTGSLQDQILVDPNLSQQSHPNAVRGSGGPVQAQYPAPRGSAGESGTSHGPLAPVRTASGRVYAIPGSAGTPEAGGCGVRFRYGNEWAQRLPAEFPAYPAAHLDEAAGADSGSCHMRVISFTTRDPWGRVLDWYRQTATRAGFDAEHQVRGENHVLGGVNTQTGGAYYLIVSPSESGSEVALIVNNGR